MTFIHTGQKKMDEIPIAQKMFELYLKYSSLKCDIEELIEEACDIVWDDKKQEYNIKFSEFSFDYYDSSFEIYEVEDGWEIPKSAYDALRVMGFDQAWVNYNKQGEPRRDKHFYFGRRNG